ELSGRVTSRSGSAVPNAEVVVIDKTGTSRQVRTNPFGKFTVTELPAGQTYFVLVRVKEHQFDLVVIDLAGDIYDLEVVARE
ncbi:MAG TPA: carboxypeptidase-like regulatory domain-containing protein, partial [Pyrinomonadaceae bacterium]|nr:carboxypeptidase-like regulatory domain-containing protein [Pyrinomonadaceae bacterium]